MAFDQNSIPKDLRPINTVRNVEDTRMAPLTSSGRHIEGFYGNPNPSTMPKVYYPSTVPDASLVPLRFNNAVPGVTRWLQHVVPPQRQPYPGVVCNSAAMVNPASGFTSSPKFGARVSSGHTNDDGGYDSVSGQNVKFLCSFGGNILPRPSDGALRYVGGQTRIISVRKDVTFGELVQKMTDLYAPNVVIKYQLPDEELDALVSVSCPDDLENMMDEFEKLNERCADGSAKLRMFLFSTLDVDSLGLGRAGDLQDTGFRYVEAVNGIMDGFGDGGRISRKESIESGGAASQISDFSGTEGVDSIGQHCQGDVTSIPSDATPRLVGVVDNTHVLYADPSAAPLAIPMVQSGPTRTFAADTQQDIHMSAPNLVQSGPDVGFPSSTFVQQVYLDPQQQTFNHANNYLQIPAPVSFPGQLLGGVGPIFSQQPSPQQLSMAGHMAMHPSFVSMRPPPAVQPQQICLDHYPPPESMSGQRVVQFPAQVVQGGIYNDWHQVLHPQQHHVEGGSQLYPQPVAVPGNMMRLDDCFMCQKQLPHAHSDTAVVQELRESPSSSLPDSRSVYQSFCLDNRGRPLMQHVPTGNIGEGNIDQLPLRARPQVERIAIPQNSDGYGMPHLQGVMTTTEVQPPYGLFVANTQPFQATNVELALGGEMPAQSNGFVVRESPREYSGKVAVGISGEDSASVAFDHLRQIDGRLENLQIHPSEFLINNEHNKTTADSVESFGVTEPPCVKPTSSGECPDNPPWSQPKETVALFRNNISPSFGAGDFPDNTPSLLSDQDTWNLQQDTHFPPPQPSKIQMKRENPLPNEPCSKPYQADCLLSNKGSAEELIKQELQAVAEGVAASVLQSSVPSNPDLSLNASNDSTFLNRQSDESHRADVEIQSRDKFEEIRAKMPEKINLGFPASDGIGRLQIIKNSDLEELRELGSGTFGTVYHGKWRGTDVAIKRINDRCFAAKPSEQERMREDFWNEAIKLADLHHPNVVAFYGVVLDGPEGSVSTVTEYMVNGSLRNALQRSERNLDKRKQHLIGMDVAFGMEYLHGKNIVHFDLKSDNLLVNLRDPHRPICKVGDLGLSKVKCQTLISGGVRGTLPWMAPELLNGSSSLVSEKVDVFSFGIVMWELITGEEPYADLHYGAIIGGIVSNTLRPPVPESCDPIWRALMEKCWSSEPSERPNFTEIANELRAMAAKIPAKGQAAA